MGIRALCIRHDIQGHYDYVPILRFLIIPGTQQFTINPCPVPLAQGVMFVRALPFVLSLYILHVLVLVATAHACTGVFVCVLSYTDFLLVLFS